jgi:hypothetical protein
MKKILLWLLPVVDVFALRHILKYYRSVGISVPWKHVKLGMIERWAGYMPAGFIMGWFAGFWIALAMIFATLAFLGPIEFYLMCCGVRPWKFFKRKPPKLTAKIFLLEGYNAVGYYIFGLLLAVVTSTLSL